jgi:hypothetical protein
MAITHSDAVVRAIGIIQAGLQSGSIKLNGTSGGATPTEAAARDLVYLSDLMNGLAKAIETSA